MLLRQLLYRTETRLLPVIAGFWLRSEIRSDYEELIRILCERMLDSVILKKMLTGSEGRDLTSGLRSLSEHQGQEEAEAFESLFGAMRIAGTDRILREKYWKTPVSVTEKLFYRGLIFRENRTISGELKACYVLPEDLRKRIDSISEILAPSAGPADDPFIVRPASPSETVSVLPPREDLPDLFTLAAALKRDSRPFMIPGADISDEQARFIEMLLSESGSFPSGKEADPEQIRSFLVQNRTAARLELMRVWRNSAVYDELDENTAQLSIIDPPDFDRRVPRNSILRCLASLQADTWWSLSGFTAAVKRTVPDFLRGSFSKTRGQIRDAEGNDLSGIGSWFQLEGAYIRFMLFGPLHWLGITQTAFEDKANEAPGAFRITKDGLFYLLESAEAEISPSILAKPNLEQAAPNISADGAITCSSRVPRYFRYTAARCCEIEKLKGDICSFRLTPNSLSEAEKAGISRGSFLALLRRFSGKAVPPALASMLASDDKVLIPATIYNATILTVPQPEILTDLLGTSRLEKWILQQINENSLMIDPKGIDEFRRYLMEKEIFVDIQR